MTKFTCKPIIIFEGCDGTGKTTAAREFADENGYRYVHFGPLPLVRGSLARMYIEAMLPALMGYQGVVLDRAWMSEVPYGLAFRGGKDRLGDLFRRMLDRVAMRAGAVMVLCDTGWGRVLNSFRARKGEEMLDSEKQLQLVYNYYKAYYDKGIGSSLPKVFYDYTEVSKEQLYTHITTARRLSPPHGLDVLSAGNWDGKIVLVGESFGEHKEYDPWYQLPFVSFSYGGCSAWLTQQLDEAKIGEHQIFWINSDQDLTMLHFMEESKILALGQAAAKKLYELKIEAGVIEHPQSWKRFKSSEPYPIKQILEAL